MTKPDAQTIKRALIDAGVEIYRTKEAEIHVAERVRLNLIMDSGVRVRLAQQMVVRFTARSQRSDFPSLDSNNHFDRVRGQVGGAAGTRGYVEAEAITVEVKDPQDQAKVLDVWHQVTYEKPAEDIDSLVDEVRWALEVDKQVGG